MFLCPAPIYWVMLGLVIIIFAIGLITNRMVDDPYREAEQQYKITVGYVIENGKSVPYKIFYTDEQTNKRTEIPSKNVTIQHISDSIYEIYVRIKRQDGDGYDYAIAKLKKFQILNIEQSKLKSEGSDIMRKGSTIAAIVSSIFPTVLFILLGLKADCIAVYFIGCIAFSIIDFINMSAVCAYKERQLKYKNSEVRKKCKNHK